MPHARVGGGGLARSVLPHASILKHTTALATRTSRVEEHLQARVDSAAAEPPNTAVAVDAAHELRFVNRRTGRINAEAEVVIGVGLTADAQA